MVTKEELAGVIDHTNLYPGDGSGEIEELCTEAREYGFGAVCVYSSRVGEAREVLGDAYGDVKVATVVGFPNGQELPEAKADEARLAVEKGAHEIDMVINRGLIREGRYEEAVEDIRAVREAVPDATLKVICENCDLETEEQKRMAYEAADEAGADFIKTATGFGEYGARVEDVELMAEVIDELGSDMGIKASGGIGDAGKALRMLEASGMELDPARFRIGASSGPAIVDSLEEGVEGDMGGY